MLVVTVLQPARGDLGTYIGNGRYLNNESEHLVDYWFFRQTHHVDNFVICACWGKTRDLMSPT